VSGGDAALKPNSITLASSELAPNMFEAASCQIPLHYSWFGASSELAPNMFGASSELASVMEFGFYMSNYFDHLLFQVRSKKDVSRDVSTGSAVVRSAY